MLKAAAAAADVQIGPTISSPKKVPYSFLLPWPLWGKIGKNTCLGTFKNFGGAILYLLGLCEFLVFLGIFLALEPGSVLGFNLEQFGA